MRNRIYAVLIALLCAAPLQGCATATPYRPVGVHGGYSDSPIDATTVKVSFEGNKETSKDTVKTYLLYRCAEVTVQKGYEWFSIVSQDVDTKHSYQTTPGQYTGAGGASTDGGWMDSMRSSVQGVYTPPQTIRVPPQTIDVQEHTATAIIKMFKGEKPQDNDQAYDAKATMESMGQAIRR